MTMTNYLLVTQHGQLKRVLDSLGIKNTDGYTEDGTQIEANLGEHIVRFSFKDRTCQKFEDAEVLPSSTGLAKENGCE